MLFMEIIHDEILMDTKDCVKKFSKFLWVP